MCEFSGKLNAWLDRELPPEEAADLDRHVEGCAECRARVDAYKRVSSQIDAYCDEALVSGARPRTNLWTAAAAAAGVAATLGALFLVWPKPRLQTPAFPSRQQAAPVSANLAEGTVVAPAPPIQRVSRPQAARSAQVQKVDTAQAENQSPYFIPEQPVIHIAIPADEMFPPGALPQGMHFVADVTLASDGSAEGMRLRPRLAGFERSTVQP
jgi:putative zinc finger protein